MKKIWPEIVEKIRNELSDSGGELFKNFELELQDEYTFLLITLFLNNHLNDEYREHISNILKNVVSPKIPDSDEDYSWMCVIKVNDEVVDSISSELI